MLQGKAAVDANAQGNAHKTDKARGTQEEKGKGRERMPRHMNRGATL